MFDITSLNKLTDALPAEVKDKVSEVAKEQLNGNLDEIKSKAMATLGLGTLVSPQTSEAATAAPTPETADAQADAASDETAELTGAEQLGSSESEEQEDDETDVA
jgi:hypothetical protein